MRYLICLFLVPSSLFACNECIEKLDALLEVNRERIEQCLQNKTKVDETPIMLLYWYGQRDAYALMRYELLLAHDSDQINP